MRKFFDGVFIASNNLKEAGIKYPIRLEYYKTSSKLDIESKFGIEVVKTEYLDENVRIETKEVPNITQSEEEQEKILELLKNNQVTPIGVEDVLEDLLRK